MEHYCFKKIISFEFFDVKRFYHKTKLCFQTRGFKDKIFLMKNFQMADETRNALITYHYYDNNRHFLSPGVLQKIPPIV